MKNLNSKKIMFVAFFEYLRRKNSYKTKLVLFNAQKDVVSCCFSCLDLYPILCITCLEIVFVLSHLHICTFFLNG